MSERGSSTLKRVPLHERWSALGAKFCPFAGYSMPLRFGKILAEHDAIRNDVGIFDVSHMGEVEFKGPRALEVLNLIVTNDVSKLAVGQAQYTVMCHESGGIVDDLLVYNLGRDSDGERHYLACVNAGNRAKDVAHMQRVAGDDCQVTDTSDDWVQLAVQGPKAVSLVDTVADIDAREIAGYHAAFATVAGVRILLSRTGYTGEDGFELYVPSTEAVAVFDAVQAAAGPDGITPCGLAARDILRLEAKMMLYGNDISDDTTPLEAGLSWVVKFDKGDFMGRAALIAQKEAGLTRRLRGFVLQGRGVMRPHFPILREGVKVGETTSGGHSFTLGSSIGLGYVDIKHCNTPVLDVEIRGRHLAVNVTKKVFYKRTGG